MSFIADIFINQNLLCMLIAYVIGSIPFGFLLAKYIAKENIQKQGSNSIGATNVLRVVKQKNPKLAKKLAAATMILDFSKGLILIIIFNFLGIDIATLWACAVLSVIGHCFSVFLKFEGGKGVATGAGSLLFFIPISVVIGLVFWFIIGKVFKISSLASLIGFSIGGISSIILYKDLSINTHTPIFIILFLVFYKHIPNIKRMIFKTETTVL